MNTLRYLINLSGARLFQSQHCLKKKHIGVRYSGLCSIDLIIECGPKTNLGHLKQFHLPLGYEMD